MEKYLVSIIVPVYNAERFLYATIESILNQSYSNWELIIVDDCSTDNSRTIINDFLKKDKRIKYFRNSENSKTAITRNNGIKFANGTFLCFLDADDLWDKDKLKKQVDFMLLNDCAFSFTGYEFADENGIPNGKKVYVPYRINYNSSLGNTIIWTSTVMFDMSKLSKEDIYMPNVPSEDTACWWRVLKIIDYAYGLNEILSFYRRTKGTLSSNKLVAIKRIWYLYRKIEKLSILHSSYCFVKYAVRAVIRRV